MLRFLGFFTLAFLFLQCNNSSNDTSSVATSDLESVENTDSYGFSEKYTRRKSNYAKEGTYLKMDKEGRIFEEALYHNDTLNGLRILYYETGDTQIVETYSNGLFEGDYRAFYENGQLELEGNYEYNEMTGEWKRYYDTGELMETVTFSENEENGPFYEYYQNGNLKAEGYYKNGDNEHGLLKKYNEEGKLIQTMNCENGICRTVWKDKSVEDVEI